VPHLMRLPVAAESWQRPTRGPCPTAGPTHRRVAMALMAVAIILLAMPSGGCKRNPRVVPVSGKVLYNGQPLPYGSIMFQPDKGQQAVADITADGTFTLSSYGPNDGAVPGKHSVSVSCYEGHRPGKAGSGDSMGKLLIPLKYTRFGSSGLTADVNDTGDGKPQEIVLELSGPPVTFK